MAKGGHFSMLGQEKKRYKLYKNGKLWATSATIILSLAAGFTFSGQINADTFDDTSQSNLQISNEASNYNSANFNPQYQLTNTSERSYAANESTSNSNTDDSSLWYHPSLQIDSDDVVAMSSRLDGHGTDEDISRSLSPGDDPSYPTIATYYAFRDNSDHPDIQPYAQKTVTRTINIQDPQSGAISNVAHSEVYFNRWVAVDTAANNELVGAGPWITVLTSSRSFPQYNIPQINGYTSYCNNKKAKIIRAENNITGNHPNEEYTITYVPDSSNESVTRTISITDPSGHPETVVQHSSGDSFENVWPEYDIPQYNGYDSYANGNKTTTIARQAAGNENVTVIVTYQPQSNDSSESQQHKTITRAIDIYQLNGQIDVVNQSVKYYRIVTHDEDGEPSYSNWIPEDNSTWAEYNIPQHDGYKSQYNLHDATIVPSQHVGPNDKDVFVDVTYVKGYSGNTTNNGNNSNIDVYDHGNYAWLDNSTVDSNGRLDVSGWHATNASYGRPYHYIIVLNAANNREISRLNVTNNEIQRKDVAQVHNVYGAEKSGFSVHFDLTNLLANLGRVQIISRYTDDPYGNGNSTDYWFTPINIDHSNNAHLDSVNINNNHLVVSGWHATNLSANKPYHVIIAFDRSLNREIARVNTTNTERPDVARAYPNVYKANQSGFVANFNLMPEFSTDAIQFISRCSSNADCNSNYIDYWFSPQRIINDNSNRAYLDNVHISGDNLSISGWHATNQSIGRPYHTIIVLNSRTGRELGRYTTNQLLQRPDVAQAFPSILNAGQSGFSVNIKLAPGMGDQPIQIISRWSAGSDANHDYVDYWFNPQNLTGDTNNHAWLDDFSLHGNQVHASGWNATSQSIGRQYHYIILFDQTTNREIQRININQNQNERSDVATTYPDSYNSLYSGFNVNFNVDSNSLRNHQLTVLSRWTNDPSGNGNAADYWFSSKKF